MKKIIFFIFFLNLSFVQNTIAREEKTNFGFSFELPSSKFITLKQQNEATIKEFLKQNGYKDKTSRTVPSIGGSTNKQPQLTTSDVLEKLYKITKTKDENGQSMELVIYMGGVYEKDFPIEIILINFYSDFPNLNEYRNRKSLDGLCNEFKDSGKEILTYCEFENVRTKKQTIDIIKSKLNLTTSLSKKIEKINYLVPYNNKVIHFAINCHMSCKKIEENFVSLISSIK